MEPETQLLSGDIVDTVAEATPEKRTGRKSMSRRSGQNGYIQEDGNWYVVRFWKDVAAKKRGGEFESESAPFPVPANSQHSNGNARPRK
jgi:hypothetical protein